MPKQTPNQQLASAGGFVCGQVRGYKFSTPRSAPLCRVPLLVRQQAIEMRAGRWLVAVVTTSCGRNPTSAAAASTKAFVHTSSSASRGRSLARRCSSTSRVSGGSSRSTPSSLMPMKSGDADGESWCGHELLNTVTTDWVEDHLGDPEVCIYIIFIVHVKM